ncbi:MAG: AraC family transcriptional regulator [Eubacteriales bacterium]|nr:AraC family transcriptional regulator [Eubacteriales bacterium]
MKKLSRFEISKQSHHPAYAMHSAHTHSYFELYYLVNGECNFFLYDNVYRMSAGSMVFIPADTLHKTTYSKGQEHERIYIEFTLDYLSDLINALGGLRFEQLLYSNFFTVPEQHINQVNYIFSQLIKEKEAPDIYSVCSIKDLFQRLIILMLRKFNNPLDNKANISSQPVHVLDESIQSAMNYICNNFSKNITLDDVAGLLHLNSSYFSKKFKTINGFGFKEYLNNVRINHSEKLLLETTLSITDIAFQCGYQNSNYYGDAFKHINGISPTEFRKIKGNVKDI